MMIQCVLLESIAVLPGAWVEHAGQMGIILKWLQHGPLYYSSGCDADCKFRQTFQ